MDSSEVRGCHTNRVTQTILPDNATNLTVYDGLGRVQFSVDARGVTNAFGYDRLGRKVSVTNAWGTPSQMVMGYGFDANGNQLYFTNASKIVTTNHYDALNRLTNIVFPDGTKTFSVYDAVGRRVAETNQDNVATLFAYDGAGRLSFVTNAPGTSEQMVTQYDYDEAGNLVRQIDALGRTNRFAFNLAGQRVAHWLPDGLQFFRGVH
ncbi:MAG TPA: hypothetical protein VN673_15155 [Clostridia bacterium]|nr:hypothetical protein [Clostridia bacterium]